MKEYSNKAFEPLDEEKNIMEAIENDEWKPVKK